MIHSSRKRYWCPWLWWLAVASAAVGCYAALGAMPLADGLLFGLTVGASTATLAWLLSRRRRLTGHLARCWLLSPAVLYSV